MKKRILSTITMLIVLTALFLEPANVKASTVANGWKLEMTTTSSNSLNIGDTVVVSIKLNGNKDVTSIMGYLDYDKTVLDTPIPITSDTNFYFSYVQGLDLLSWSSSTPSRPSGGDLATLTFYVKKAVNETTVRFQNVVASNAYPYDSESVGSASVTITNANSKKIVLSTDNVAGSNYVTIPVRFAVNDGWRSLSLSASFDPTRLQFSSVQIDSAINTKVVMGNSTTSGTTSGTSSGSSTTTQNGYVTTNFTVTPEIIEDIKNTGTLFYYTFRLLPASTTSGSSSSSGTTGVVRDPINTEVTFSVSNVTDINQNKSFYLTTARSIVTMNGSVQITGDVNGNGKIDLVDVLYIVQYYNRVRTLTSVEFTLADVDKNGVVNLVDAKRILRYYNGEISTF